MLTYFSPFYIGSKRLTSGICGDDVIVVVFLFAAVAVGSAGLLGAAVATTTQSVTEDTTKQTFLIYLFLLDVCWRCCVLE